MKKLKILLIVIFLMAFNVILGQSVNKSTKIGGVTLSQTITNSGYQKISMSNCDTIFSFGTAPYPSGLTWDGQNLWYVDINYIFKVSSTGMHLDSIINPASDNTIIKVGDLTYDGITLWYADEQSAQLFKINPTNGNTLQQFNLPSFGQSDPNGFGLAWDGVNIWHAQYDPPRLYKLSPLNGSIIDSLTTTEALIGIEFVNGNLYGVNGEQIFKINPNTGIFHDSTSWCVPFSLGLTCDGSNFWNVSGSDPFIGTSTGGKQKIYKLNSDLISSVNEHSNSNSNVEIFPNPTTESISVRGQNIKTIEIYNVRGEKTYVTSNFKYQAIKEIDLSKSPKGIYFVKIYDGKEIYTEKIVLH